MSVTPDSSDPTAEWWESDTFSAALGDFRKTLKAESPGSEQLHLAWVRLALMGYLHGRSVTAARAVYGMMKQLHQGRHDLWWRPVGDAAAIVHFKMAVALAEDPGFSRQEIFEMAGHFEAAARQHGTVDRAGPLLRMAVHLRLGDLKQAEDLYPALFDWWSENCTGDEDDDDDDSDEDSDDSSEPRMPVCGSGTAQLLIEFLLATKRHDEALAIVDRVLDRKGCIGFCEAGPHGLVGWILQLLLDRGEAARAEGLFKRGRLLAPASDPRHCGAAGDRILYLARSGCLAEAAAEVETVGRALEGREPTGWQQLRLGGRLAVALPLLLDAEPKVLSAASMHFAERQIARGKEALKAFEVRNGNRLVSDLWPELDTALVCAV